MVSTDLDEQGRIVQITPMQKLTYGELSGAITPRIRSLDETMRNASFETELSTAIMQAMWHKWVMIASLGLVTCLLDGRKANLFLAQGDLGDLYLVVVGAIGIGFRHLLHQDHQALHVIDPVETDAYVGRTDALRDIVDVIQQQAGSGSVRP